MLPDDWHLTQDVDDFLARAGDFLCSRPALHNTPLTDIEKLRTRRAAELDAETRVFGRLESGGEVRAIFYLTPRGRLGLTPLSVDQDRHPRRSPGRPRPLSLRRPPACRCHDSTKALAVSWSAMTGGQDREQVVRWCREFCVDVGERSSIDLIEAGSQRRYLSGRRIFTVSARSPHRNPAQRARVASGTTRVSATGTSRSGRPRTAPPSRWRPRPRSSAAWSGWTPSTPRPTSGAAATRGP